MITKEQRIKMAEAEGYYFAAECRGWFNAEGRPCITGELPTYDNDNDLDRFIRGMDRQTLANYHVALIGIINGGFLSVHQVTTEQKQEAIGKSKRWEETT